jgi:DNA-binding NarL/FixJ family response regulator
VKSNGQHHPDSPARGEDLNAIEQRRQQVAYLVAAHWTYRQIAAHLGVSVNTVALDVKAVRQAWRDRSAADYASHG